MLNFTEQDIDESSDDDDLLNILLAFYCIGEDTNQDSGPESSSNDSPSENDESDDSESNTTSIDCKFYFMRFVLSSVVET